MVRNISLISSYFENDIDINRINNDIKLFEKGFKIYYMCSESEIIKEIYINYDSSRLELEYIEIFDDDIMKKSKIKRIDLWYLKEFTRFDLEKRDIYDDITKRCGCFIVLYYGKDLYKDSLILICKNIHVKNVIINVLLYSLKLIKKLTIIEKDKIFIKKYCYNMMKNLTILQFKYILNELKSLSTSIDDDLVNHKTLNVLNDNIFDELNKFYINYNIKQSYKIQSLYREYVHSYENISKFYDYIFSSNNSIINTNTLINIYQDMNQPLDHYFIYSSNFIYINILNNHSLFLLEPYIRLLVLGVKYFSLNIVDGIHEPLVAHNINHFIKIPLETIILTIREYAFYKSRFPLILYINNNCSSEQYQLVNQIFDKHLKDYIETNIMINNRLKSPNDLLGKIIIVTPNSNITNKSSISNSLSESTINVKNSFNKTTKLQVNDDICNNSCYHGKMSREECENILHSVDEINGIFIVRDSESAKNSYAISVTYNNQIIHVKIKTFKKDNIKYYVKDDKKFNSFSKLIEYYKKYSLTNGKVHLFLKYSYENYVNKIKKQRTFENNFDSIDSIELNNDLHNSFAKKYIISDSGSLNEESLTIKDVNENELKLYINTNNKLFYNNYQLLRCIPSKDDSNLPSILVWSLGINISPVNFHISDTNFKINNGFFMDNGMCGYILKPQLFIERNYTLFHDIFISNQPKLKFKFSIICAKDVIGNNFDEMTSPFIEVNIYGALIDQFKFTTKSIHNDCIFPFFHTDDIEIKLYFPEMAIMILDVRNKISFNQSQSLGYGIIKPINMIEGIHNIKLVNEWFEEYFTSQLLLKYTII